MTAPRRAVHAVVRGRVQHVGFRWFTERHASELGLGGWVRNTADGDVEVFAEGDASRVAQLLEALRRGPAHAEVASVDVQERAVTDAAPDPVFEILP